MVACRFVVILSFDQSIESIESLIRSPMSMLKCYKWYLNPHFLLKSLFLRNHVLFKLALLAGCPEKPRGLLDFFRRGTEKPFPPANFAGDYVTSLRVKRKGDTCDRMVYCDMIDILMIYTILYYLFLKFTTIYSYSNSFIDIVGRLDIPFECTFSVPVAT